MGRSCTINGCTRAYYAKGFCQPHYTRNHKYGDPLAGGPWRGSVLQWLRETLKHLAEHPTDECVLHPFHPGNGGYGAVRINGHKMYLCRAVLILTGRELPPPGGHTRHSCGNPPCVNPLHIRAGTAQENAEDRERHGRTAHGAQIPQFWIPDEVVQEIRSSPETNKAIAARLGCHPTTVSKIRSGQRRTRST